MPPEVNRVRRLEEENAKLKPRILVDIDEANQTIAITDNGPGIDAGDADDIVETRRSVGGDSGASA